MYFVPCMKYEQYNKFMYILPFLQKPFNRKKGNITEREREDFSLFSDKVPFGTRTTSILFQHVDREDDLEPILITKPPGFWTGPCAPLFPQV